MPAFDPLRPFNDLPDLPPQAELETHAVLKQCIEARSTLAALRQAVNLIPNQDVLINSIPLREARDSSAIENIVTTNDKLFRQAAIWRDDADQNTEETLRYGRALYEGYARLDRSLLTTATAIRVCRTIRNTEINIRTTSDTALKNGLTGDIIYTPPAGEALLREKLRNWEDFIHNETQIDPLVRMAVSHYQFEAIHPFTDGNGRTGRILNILFMVGHDLLDIPVLYLSKFILENRDEYYRRLLNVTVRHEWEAWVMFMLIAVEQTAIWTTNKIHAIRELLDRTSEYVAAVVPSIYSRELIELIFQRPYCRISDLVETGIAKRVTASKYLKKLCAAGVLEETKSGREKYFIHSKFLQLLMDEINDVPQYGATL